MNAKKITLITVLIVGFVMMMTYVNRFDNTPESPLNRPAPVFELGRVDDATDRFKLADHIGKEFLIVNFWATDCAPCRDEMPIVQDLSTKLPADARLVSVMENEIYGDESPVKMLESFRKKIPITFPVYYDGDHLAADLYGTHKIPETYVIDKTGTVVRYYAGSIGEVEVAEILSTVVK